MKNFRKPFHAAVIVSALLLGSSCADDQLAKGVLVLGGAGAGALVGSQMNSSNPMLSTGIGAVAGAGLGFLLGGLVGKKS